MSKMNRQMFLEALDELFQLVGIAPDPAYADFTRWTKLLTKMTQAHPTHDVMAMYAPWIQAIMPREPTPEDDALAKLLVHSFKKTRKPKRYKRSRTAIVYVPDTPADIIDADAIPDDANTPRYCSTCGLPQPNHAMLCPEQDQP